MDEFCTTNIMLGQKLDMQLYVPDAGRIYLSHRADDLYSTPDCPDVVVGVYE